MKQETYDIPAYKFMVVIPAKEIEARDDTEYVDKFNNLFRSSTDVNTNNLITIPFENVDGLIVEELLQVIRRKGFAFACMAQWVDNNQYPQMNMYTYFYKTFVAPDLAKDFFSHRIDGLIEVAMENDYNYSEDATKEIFRCFFERHQDGSYKKTKARIKRIEKMNK